MAALSTVSAPATRQQLVERVEPWRDWAILTAFNQGLLVLVWLAHPSWPWLLAAAVLLAVGLATATLTVLHDAGHRRLARGIWPNVLAVQTAAPIGLWVGHWTLKHRVHHRVTQVYPLDDATRSSGMVRLHPSAPLWPVHRYQHLYAWLLYGLAWLGELRSQLGYLHTGALAGVDPPPTRQRLASFVVEKGLCALVLAPYAVLIGPIRLAVLLLVAMTLASVIAAVVLVVGHINSGLSPTATAPERAEWTAHLVRTSASFNTRSRAVRWLTGGMTHHLAHHLRATAPRAELPRLHQTVVADVVASSGSPMVEYPTLRSAVRGHWQVLRDLGHTAGHNPTGDAADPSGSLVATAR